MPSNEGRGYVLRRLIRRAFRHGNLIGIEEPFLYKLVGVVSDIMKDAYPELLSLGDYISKVCLSEEERFALTLSSGLRYLYQYLEEAEKKSSKILSGKKVFKLYDTFGFPLDLSQELAEERNIAIDVQSFQKELEKQRQRARLSWKGDAKEKERKVYEKLKGLRIQFIGYEKNQVPEAEVLAILKDGKRVKELHKEESGEVVLDQTPFYAEAGGQVGDKGLLKNPRFSAIVEDTYFPIPELIAHKIKVIAGEIKQGDKVEASIDVPRRRAISNNHTATHLLHAALRQTLGDHIKQAGSLVVPSHLRFDFTHFSPLTKEEIRKIEFLVNEKIRENIKITTSITTLEEGLKEGAVAIFEEKYGEKVKKVAIRDFSKELCGGIHVPYTGQIGLFKIISESSIAAGMRRIDALTGEEALEYIEKSEEFIEQIQEALDSSRKDVLFQVEKLKDQVKEKEKENRALRKKLAKQKYERVEEQVRKIKGVSVLSQRMEVLGTTYKQKVYLVASITKDLTKRIKADELIKELAKVFDGGGGGRSDFAQAGGTKTELLDKAIEQSYSILKNML